MQTGKITTGEVTIITDWPPFLNKFGSLSETFFFSFIPVSVNAGCAIVPDVLNLRMGVKSLAKVTSLIYV